MASPKCFLCVYLLTADHFFSSRAAAASISVFTSVERNFTRGTSGILFFLTLFLSPSVSFEVNLLQEIAYHLGNDRF